MFSLHRAAPRRRLLLLSRAAADAVLLEGIRSGSKDLRSSVRSFVSSVSPHARDHHHHHRDATRPPRPGIFPFSAPSSAALSFKPCKILRAVSPSRRLFTSVRPLVFMRSARIFTETLHVPCLDLRIGFVAVLYALTGSRTGAHDCNRK